MRLTSTARMAITIALGASLPLLAGAAQPDETPADCAVDLYVVASAMSYATAEDSGAGIPGPVAVPAGLACGTTAAGDEHGVHELTVGGELVFIRAGDAVQIPHGLEDAEYETTMATAPAQRGLFGFREAVIRPYPAGSIEAGRELAAGTLVEAAPGVTAQDYTDALLPAQWTAVRIGETTGWIETRHLVDPAAVRTTEDWGVCCRNR